MRGDQLGHPTLYLGAHPALRPGSVTHPLHLSAARPLPEYLLHIAKAHPKHSRQRAKAAPPTLMRQEYLPPQVVFIGSRHLVFVAESRLFYITLSLILL